MTRQILNVKQFWYGDKTRPPNKKDSGRRLSLFGNQLFSEWVGVLSGGYEKIGILKHGSKGVF